MIALSTAVEPLRMANKLTGQSVYDWSIVSLDGQPTPASNGLQLAPTVPLEQVGPVDILFVCGGVEVQEAVSPKIVAALRRLAERRVPLGALCTGGYALAKAGLLDKYRATIHWENLSALREEFPRIHLSDQLFTIDRDRFTCSGGVAPLDLAPRQSGGGGDLIERQGLLDVLFHELRHLDQALVAHTDLGAQWHVLPVAVVAHPIHDELFRNEL